MYKFAVANQARSLFLYVQSTGVQTFALPTHFVGFKKRGMYYSLSYYKFN